MRNAGLCFGQRQRGFRIVLLRFDIRGCTVVGAPGTEAAIVNRLDALELEIRQPFGLVAVGCRRMAISKILFANQARFTINAGNE